MAEAPNYHINLWPEPPGPSTYLCLLCAVNGCTEPDILTHLTTVHAVTPVPSPLAATPPLLPTFTRENRPHAPEEKG